MEYYCYVSTRACYDPAKMILLFAPDSEAATKEAAAEFAKKTGWELLAEYDSDVLVVPVAKNGWSAEADTLPCEIYDSIRNDISSRCGKSLIGRRGKIWCWETMIYWVGYEQGAEFAGRCAVCHPNHFAAAALVRGAARDYSAGSKPSDHWLVRQVSDGYNLHNNQIPVCLWLLDAEPEAVNAAVQYYSAVNGFDPAVSTSCEIGGIAAKRYAGDEETAAQLFVSEADVPTGAELAMAVMDGLFHRVIRWKNGPDGTLAKISGQCDFYTNGRFEMTSVTVNCLEYSCAVHLPAGMSREDVRGLPLVFSIHGRGEPAWLFAEKNGWDLLADKTREFVLAVPDSPGNVWQLTRDVDAFDALIRHLCEQYQLDRTRVYLTGFSNGGSITREVSTMHPEWFAAAAPFNGPVHVPDVVMADSISPGIVSSGYELPFWITVGDSDPAARVDVDEQLDIMLEVNSCSKRSGGEWTTKFEPDMVRTGENYYTSARGYRQGDRFTTLLYCAADGIPRVGYTVMKDMPHGAIVEQASACWEFLCHFSRPNGQKKVVWQELD